MTHRVQWIFVLMAFFLVSCSPTSDSENVVETGDTVTAEDYQRAEQFLSAHTADLVYDSILAQYWQEDDRLVYQKRTSQGLDYVLADLLTQTKSPLFDLERLTDVLSEQLDEELDAADLNVSRIEIESATQQVTFAFKGSSYRLDLDNYSLAEIDESDFDEFLSPDGSKAAYINDHNLWVRNTDSGERTQLTFDGIEDYGYATNNAGWTAYKKYKRSL